MGKYGNTPKDKEYAKLVEITDRYSELGNRLFHTPSPTAKRRLLKEYQTLAQQLTAQQKRRAATPGEMTFRYVGLDPVERRRRFSRRGS